MEGDGLLAVDIDMRRRTIWVEGVELSFAMLRILANPNESIFYRMVRHEGVLYAQPMTAEEVKPLLVSRAGGQVGSPA